MLFDRLSVRQDLNYDLNFYLNIFTICKKHLVYKNKRSMSMMLIHETEIMAWGMVQSVNCLLYKHEDLGLDFPAPMPRSQLCLLTSVNLGKSRKRQAGLQDKLARLSNQFVCVGFPYELYLRRQFRDWWREAPNITQWPPHICTHIYFIHISMHVHTHSQPYTPIRVEQNCLWWRQNIWAISSSGKPRDISWGFSMSQV